MSAEALWKQIWTRPGKAAVQIGVDERIREQVDARVPARLMMENDEFDFSLEIDIRGSAQDQAEEDYEQEDYDD